MGPATIYTYMYVCTCNTRAHTVNIGRARFRKLKIPVVYIKQEVCSTVGKSSKSGQEEKFSTLICVYIKCTGGAKAEAALGQPQARDV